MRDAVVRETVAAAMEVLELTWCVDWCVVIPSPAAPARTSSQMLW